MKRRTVRPTLSDVAREAQVGTSTVSRVINGGHRVDPLTLARVNDVMKALGYHPNQAARTLKSKRARTVGVIVPTISDPFFASLIEVAQTVARLHHCGVMIAASGEDLEQELASVAMFEGHRVDGLLLVPAAGSSRRLIAALRRLAIPVVSVDRPTEAADQSSVVCDNCSAARRAVEHLIQHGRHRILCFGGAPSLYTVKERVRGYCMAMSDAGLEPMIEMPMQDYAGTESTIMGRLAAPDRPDAIFGVYGLATARAFEVLSRRRIPMPDQVALFGFDDFQFAELLCPAVSVVQQPVEQIASTAAKLMFEQLEEEKPPGPRRITIPARLIFRESCGCPA